LFGVEIKMAVMSGKMSDYEGTMNHELTEAVQMPSVRPTRSESKQSKGARGGKRPGAGRKPNLIKRWVSRLSPATAAEMLERLNPEQVI
jgi:hypothetical protein